MIRLISIFYLILLLNPCDYNQSKSKEIPKSNKLPKDILFIQRAYPFDEIKSGAYTNGRQWLLFEKLKKTNRDMHLWEFVGPTNIGGRITDIEIAFDDPQVYYVGAASGGVFKSIDAGTSWIPIFDDQPFLSIGDIELSQNTPDLVWVGTGEPNAGGGSMAYDGDGVYRSTDGGLTWQNKGLTKEGSIAKIKVDPNNDKRLYAAAMGPLFRKDTNRGVYRTIDGGDNWDKILFISDSTGVIDLSIHPTNGDILYATSWERIRRPNVRQYGGSTSGIHKTIDGGDTWVELTNGLPSLPTQKGRISIDICKSKPNVLYAMYSDAIGNIQGVYKTNNGGDTWTTVFSSPLINAGFHWWFEGIFVDPKDENTIYSLGLRVQKSLDGGSSWFNSFPNAHVDQHALAFNPTVSGEVLLGNDGGFYKSRNSGNTYVKDSILPITQLYRFHVDFQNPNKIYAGAQDNSTMRTTSGGIDDWSIITGGDGFQPLVDPNNTNVIFALSQYGNLVKSTNNGVNFSSSTTGIPGSDRKNWDTPITFDPANSQIMYYGANRLFKSTNGGALWFSISPDLSNGPHAGNLIYGTITTISVSPIDNQKITVGTDDGNVWLTHNGGSTWIKISDQLPTRWVTKVLTDRDDANSLYVTFSGFRYGEDFGHVYKSIDNGNTWTNISGNLPDVPVNSIVKDMYGILYLATDIGVMVSSDEGTSWELLGENMPSVVITDLHLHEQSKTLYAATYGRSSYKMDISQNISEAQIRKSGIDLILFPNPATELIVISLSRPSFRTETQLFDLMGRLVFSEIHKSNQIEFKINIRHLPRGTYFLKIIIGQENLIKKVILL